MTIIPLRLLLLLQCLATFSYGYTQTIDRLTTEEQVLSFIKGLKADFRDMRWHPSKPGKGLIRIEQRIKAFGAVSFEKADFDHNGQLDLLFNGYRQGKYYNSFAVLAFGKDSFLIKDLGLEPTAHLIALKTMRIGDSLYIGALRDVYVENPKSMNAHFRPRVDTLVWAFNEFIERSMPCECTIEKLSFCLIPGFGFFPPMRIVLTEDSAVLQSSQAYNPQSTVQSPLDSGGTFVTRIDPEMRSRIFGILTYMNFPRLKNNYAVPETDNPTGVLQVLYNKTRTKKIVDYGETGTRTLRLLQSILIDLRPKLTWKKIGFDDAPLGFDCIYESP